jgi:hypothetical protein
MALTPEDLAQIKELFSAPAAPVAAEPVAPVPPPAEYYIHLADGRVVTSGDSQSSHIDGVAVIGRYPMSEEAKEATASE